MGQLHVKEAQCHAIMHELSAPLHCDILQTLGHISIVVWQYLSVQCGQNNAVVAQRFQEIEVNCQF